MQTNPRVVLGDGPEIPQVGLGLWKVKDQAEFDTSFKAALVAGYRHFDTAQAYHNEQFLGKALQNADVKREDVWITTKIAVQNFGHKHAVKSFERSLKALQTEYVDLLLLHFPVPLLRKSSWLALEGLQAQGKAKTIGVSNYTVRHLREMQKYAHVVPAVNQVELHVFLQQPELVEYCRQQNIALEAYSPLAHGRAMTDPIIAEVAKKHDKSYAQIMLRWCVEKGFVVLPKSVTPERIQQNIDVFDFNLDPSDMQKLAWLNKNLRTCWDPTLVP